MPYAINRALKKIQLLFLLNFKVLTGYLLIFKNFKLKIVILENLKVQVFGVVVSVFVSVFPHDEVFFCRMKYMIDSDLYLQKSAQ